MPTLTKNSLNPDPIQQFTLWFNEAKQQEEIDATAMTLATVNAAYEVSARIVLLKQADEQGFAFFTNYTSPKAHDLDEINNAALVFWWPKTERQVRITGKVEKLDNTASDNYFASRDKNSRLGALASKQSNVIPDRAFLMNRFAQLQEQYAKHTVVPRPEYWGGYVLVPNAIEFWQAGEHRLHDRFLYKKVGNQWQICQLSP
jgi:pyridoxamine 5'-phosphate oxidase